MLKRVFLLIGGLASGLLATILMIAGESHDVPLSWIALAAVGAGLAFKLFYGLEE